MAADPEAPQVPRRLLLAPRSVALAVATVGATFVVLRLLAGAERVLVWLLIASSSAALLYPAIERLARRLPRALAVALVAATTLGGIGLVTYGFVGGIVRQTAALEREAPRLARDIESGGRFAEAAREADLSDRTRRFVEEVPERLRGGTPAEALRAAATRGVAFLAVSVLTLFFLLHGPNLLATAAWQIHDDHRRATARRVASAVYHRAFGYARGTIAVAALSGLVAYALARLTGVPGPAPLALWVALWDAVPVLGAAIGALPIVILAAVIDPVRGAVLALAFVAYQVAEYVLLQRPIERRTIKVGPFLTAAAGFAGLELYGLAGALLAVLGVTVAVVVVDESFPA